MADVASLPDLGFKFVTGIHRGIFDLTNGRIAGTVAGMAVVRLTTTGRQTGRRRTTMLTAPIQDENRVVLVASKGGARRHPSWYVNLRDDPQVSITMRGETRLMMARTASAAEKAELWPAIVAAYRGYASYQDKTAREIPVVLLEPVRTGRSR